MPSELTYTASDSNPVQNTGWQHKNSTVTMLLPNTQQHIAIYS